jgi:hypothetical protein
MVITSPEKLPKSPIGVKVLHTSECDPAKLALAVNKDAAIAVPSKRLVLYDIISSLYVIVKNWIVAFRFIPELTTDDDSGIMAIDTV